MIGKVMQNSSFRATTQYVLTKESAELLGGNMGSSTVDLLTAEFHMSQNLNPNIKRPVYHFTISLPHSEHLSQHQWLDLSRDYAQKMGLNPDENQYFVARHSDRQHQHIHIVASRISVLNGRAVETWRDRYRSQAVLRKLEREYGLESVPCSWEVGQRAMTKGQLERLNHTGVLPVKQQLQKLIDHAACDRPSLSKLVMRLQEQGVEVRIALTHKNKVKGISYAMETQTGRVSMAGCDIGSRYSFPGLQKRLGINYDPLRDHHLLQPPTSRQIYQQVIANSDLPQAPKQEDLLAKASQPSKPDQPSSSTHSETGAVAGQLNLDQTGQNQGQRKHLRQEGEQLPSKLHNYRAIDPTAHPFWQLRNLSPQQEQSKQTRKMQLHSQPTTQHKEDSILKLVHLAKTQDPNGAQADAAAVSQKLISGDELGQIKDYIRQHSSLVKRWEQSDSASMAMAKTNLYFEHLHSEAAMLIATNKQREHYGEKHLNYQSYSGRDFEQS